MIQDFDRRLLYPVFTCRIVVSTQAPVLFHWNQLFQSPFGKDWNTPGVTVVDCVHNKQMCELRPA